MADDGLDLDRPSKKLKALTPSIRVHQLLKAQLVCDGQPLAPSPGAFHACRVATIPRRERLPQVYIASGKSVYSVEVKVPDDAAVACGKERVLMATACGAGPATRLPAIRHGAEVQTLCYRPLHDSSQSGLLASVDASGHAVVMPCSTAGDPASLPSGDDGAAVQAFSPGRRTESGWCGADLLHTPASSQVAVARFFPRDISLYDVPTGQLTHTYNTVQMPTALMYLPTTSGSTITVDNIPSGAPLLAVAEESTITLWDARCVSAASASASASGRQAAAAAGCVQRIPRLSPPGSSLNCLAWCPAEGGLLGTTGSERCVWLLDPRKWRPVCKWTNCLRQAAQHLAFSALDPTHAYVCGLDNEVVCDSWRSPASSLGRGAGGGGEEAAAGALGVTGGDSVAASGGRAHGARGMAAAAAASALDGDEAGLGGGADAAGVLTWRGDGRWLGMSHVAAVTADGAARDVVTGYSASGSVFIASAIM